MRSLIIALLLFVLFTVKSQVIGYNLPPKSFYDDVKITMKDFTKYECKNVYIKSDSVSFLNINKQKYESLALSKIDYLRVQEGNQALKWCGYGALLMGLIAVINVTEYPNNMQNPSGLIIGFTLSGAVIGSLIGLAVPKWKTYYLNY
jgi:hypothetical protein